MRIKSFGLGNPGIALFAVLAFAAPAGAQTLPPPGSFQPIAPAPAPGAAPAPAAPSPGTVQVGPAPAPGTVQVGPAPTPGTVQIGPAPSTGTVQVGPAGPLPSPGTVVPGPQVGPPPGAAVCQTEAEPLVKARATRLAAFQAAAKRKAQPTELCGLIKSFVANETKFRAFLVKNQQLCGIPNEVVDNVKKNYAQAATAQRRICAAAAAGPRPGPQTPSFGSPYRTGTGTFDTLGGPAVR